MKISVPGSLKVNFPVQGNSDLKFRRSKSLVSTQKGFGPLQAKTNNSPSKLTDKIETTWNKIQMEEKLINEWMVKLQKGYIPSTPEMVQLQALVHQNLKKINLISKLIESLQSTIRRLKQTQL